MADLLGPRRELRLAFSRPGVRARRESIHPGCPAIERGLARLSSWPGCAAVAAMAALITLGWFAHAELGPRDDR